MRLPNFNTTQVFANRTWPPLGWTSIYETYSEHSAWYAGDPNILAQVFAGRLNPFWAREIGAERRVAIHVPVAGDISSTSADLLFREHPKIVIPDACSDSPIAAAKQTQERLDEIIEQGGVYSTLLEAAETCSAMGGVVLKVNWDKALADYPILSVTQADNALPEFSQGILSGITLWDTLETDQNGVVWRRLEKHTKGHIETELWEGDSGSLGAQRDLIVRSETRDALPSVSTGLDGLACVYIPNVRPYRKGRGLYLGRSDYASAEGLMDSLDETYTSLIRDIRLGVGRLIIPESFLDLDSTTGKQKFKVDTEAFSRINAMQGMGPLSDSITMNQFAIRAQEHVDVALALARQIFSNAGYSPQSFGMDLQTGNPESGKALTIRERRSFTTTAKKAEYWRSKLEYLFTIMLQIDREKLGNGTAVYPVRVEIQDNVKADITEIAPSVELLNRAQAISRETKVRMLHPDWNAGQILAEVERIKDEQGENVPDPLTLGNGSFADAQDEE